MTDFRDKNVLITGAASGIGRLLAERIAAGGGRLVLWDIDEPGLDAVKKAIAASGGRVEVYRCDVANRENVYAVARRVLDAHGPADILINNAGVVTGKPLVEASDEAIERSFAINALAHFWTVRAFLPAMLERNSGHVVSVASAAGLVGAPRLTDYCASKFAAVGFDESLRLELRQLGSAVKTTVVCPFYVKTGMFEGVKTRFPWLLPILEPEYVARRIVRAIRRDRRRLILPRFALVAPPLKALPPAAFDPLLKFFGVTQSMDEFRGRGPATEGP